MLTSLHHEAIVAELVKSLPKPFASLSPVYLAQARLCDRLETVADQLPHIDHPQIDWLLPVLRVKLPEMMRFEEALILPMLRTNEANFGPICRQIIWEHEEDADEAFELAALLDDNRACCLSQDALSI